jgi:flagellar basal body P-ring formation protein FlgA
MTRSVFAAFIALATLACSANAETATQGTPDRPILKSDATITGDIVRIGDLIDNAGIVASVPIFRAPDLGYTGTISSEAVLEAVRSHALIGVATGGVREIVVRRATRTIPIKDVEDAIAGVLSAKFNLGPVNEILVNFTRDVHAVYVEPSSQGAPRVKHVDFDVRSGHFDATVEIPTGRGTFVHLSGRAFATVEVATVTRTIDSGTILRDSDLQLERRPRSEVCRDIVTKREQVIGFAARGTLQPGRPVRVADLMKPDLIQRNETVTLVYEVPGIVVTIRGKAIDSGAEGDVISVLNEQSKRKVQGTIVGPGRVLVNNGSPRFASNTSKVTPVELAR